MRVEKSSSTGACLVRQAAARTSAPMHQRQRTRISGIAGRGREIERERRSFADATHHAHLAVHLAREVAADRESEADATGRFGEGAMHLDKGLEHRVEAVGGAAHPRIAHVNQTTLTLPFPMA